MLGYLEMMKNGSKIHIKKKNRGKFTKSANAAGKSVQEHAHDVMNNLTQHLFKGREQILLFKLSDGTKNK